MSAPDAPDEPTKGAAPSYKAVCISMYVGDLATLDARVARLKARGVRGASRSALIRYALAQLDVSKVPSSI